MTNPLIDARRKAESDSRDPQERNRLWWERGMSRPLLKM